MNPILRTRSPQKRKGGQCGSMLLELLIAIVVLAIGMGGLLVLLASAMSTNNRSGNDTSSTMIAEHIIEQISSQPANSSPSTTLSIPDCAGSSWTISTAGAPNGAGNSGSYGGNGANLTSNGTVDWTQDYASVPTGYKLKYVACGTGGRQSTYDTRWNIVSLNATNQSSRMIVVSARPTGDATVGGLHYVIPANLQTIGGVQ
jgi:Tfp pilus assembly protein PilV